MRPGPLAGGLATALVLPTFLVAGPGPLAGQDDEPPGRAVYDRWCAACHGVEGRGDGPAAEWMLPRPRDFTLGVYQMRTTASGELPTDDDIRRVIDDGMPGTTMPGWRQVLTSRERADLVTYVKSFSRFFDGAEAEPLEFGRAPGVSDEALAEGREFYERIECNRCHGEWGRGDGSSAPTLEDDLDVPVRAADLTRNWAFNGGGSVEDIYRRLRTGIDGTPMPSFSDLLDAEFMTDEQLWNVAHYVRSLAPEEAPRVRDVIRAGRVDEGQPLPATVDDEAWSDVERFYVPLAGQIVVSPRWFDPSVKEVWIQALHDDTELALLVSWNDPSESPDSAWLEWKTKIVGHMAPAEGEPVDAAEPSPDRLAVQFPQEMPEGMARPYFLMGDGSTPVYLWDWDAQRGALESVARGLTSVSAQDDEHQALTAVASWEAGRWRVLFRRTLESDDPEDLRFEIGRAIPIAFSAWDGDHGESGTRRAVSSWYFIHLESPMPPKVVVAPLLATILTAGLGLLVVARAQKRERMAGVASVDRGFDEAAPRAGPEENAAPG